MNHISQTLTVIVPVLMVIFLGYFSKKLNLIKDQGIEGMRFFITSIALPAAMFKAIASMEMSSTVWICCGIIFCMVSLVMFIGFLLTKIFPKLNGMLPFLITCFEAGMLGYPLYTLLFGIEKLSYAIIIALGSDLFVFTIYTTLLKRKEGNTNLIETLKGMLKSPIFISIVLGLIFSTTNIYFKFEGSMLITTLFSVFNFLGQPIACVMLFVIGSTISFSKKNIVQEILICLIRLALMGLMAYLAIQILDNIITLDKYFKTAILLLFFLPGPYMLPIFSENESNRSFTSTVLSLNLVFSMIAFTIITYSIPF